MFILLTFFLIECGRQRRHHAPTVKKCPYRYFFYFLGKGTANVNLTRFVKKKIQSPKQTNKNSL